MKRAGIVVCSNGQKQEYHKQNEELVSFLNSIGIETKLSSCIYEKHGIFSGTPHERAEQLMKMFNDPEIEEIYDISGGDVANQILDELDYEAIAKSKATLWGYSDLTVVLNAIHTMTGRESVLYQIKNMVYGRHMKLQRERFQTRKNLFTPEVVFVQGKEMRGVVVGGNIRCFLKLAGTRYFPDLKEKVLLLEAFGGEAPQMAAYLAQLKQMGAFEKVNGILLGTFSAMEKNHSFPDILTLVKEYANTETPVAKTNEIGHGDNAKAIVIGREIELKTYENCSHHLSTPCPMGT